VHRDPKDPLELPELLITLINILLDHLELLVHKAMLDLREKREILAHLEQMVPPDHKESPELMELLVHKDCLAQEAMMELLVPRVPQVILAQRENLELMELKA
jgi:hypothetical protein